LLEDFDQPLASRQLAQGRLVEIGAELGEKPQARGTAPGRAGAGRPPVFIALICAFPPTRLTEMPTLIAGRTFE